MISIQSNWRLYDFRSIESVLPEFDLEGLLLNSNFGASNGAPRDPEDMDFDDEFEDFVNNMEVADKEMETEAKAAVDGGEE